MSLEIAYANRPCRGEKVSGDSIQIMEGPLTTLVVADGLGHGPMAAQASLAFCEYVKSREGEPLPAVIKGSSKHISHTRGAAAAIVLVDTKSEKIFFCGVGNIELQAVSVNSIRPVCTPGIIGRPIRKVVEFSYDLASGDLIAIYSDGISSRFDLKEYRTLPAQECADRILENHGKYHDDATVVVTRYRR